MMWTVHAKAGEWSRFDTLCGQIRPRYAPSMRTATNPADVTCGACRATIEAGPTTIAQKIAERARNKAT